MKIPNERQHLKRIAAGIRTARKRRRVTARALAATLGIAPSIVSAWESGRSFPGGRALIAMAESLGTTTDELLGLNPKPPVMDNAECKRFYDGVIDLIDKLDIPKA